MKIKFVLVRLIIMICLCWAMVSLVSGQQKKSISRENHQYETRCGWFSNPTPANVWLYDRDGEWTIGVQGGHQAEGDGPAFGARQWVKTNNNYGYGCACLQVQVNRKTHEVIKIKSGRARSLSTCRLDPQLKKWATKYKFH